MRLHRIGGRCRGAGLALALALTLSGCGQGGDRTEGEGPAAGSPVRPALTEADLRAQAAGLLAKLGAPADAAARAQYEGAFDAAGSEPDWRLTLLQDFVSFSRPGLEEVSAIPSARNYRAQGAFVEAGPLSIAIAAGQCSYGEGGEVYPFTATVLYEGIAYEGCARAGDAAAAPASRGWAVDLSQLVPAIDACLTRVEAQPARVTIAYVNEENNAAVRLLEADGGRSECVASLDGARVVSVVPLTDRDTFRGERDPMFTRAPAGPPASACYANEEVQGSSGATLGWLSRKTC